LQSGSFTCVVRFFHLSVSPSFFLIAPMVDSTLLRLWQLASNSSRWSLKKQNAFFHASKPFVLPVALSLNGINALPPSEVTSSWFVREEYALSAETSSMLNPSEVSRRSGANSGASPPFASVMVIAVTMLVLTPLQTSPSTRYSPGARRASRREFYGMLCEKAVGFDAAVPLVNERHEPLHTVYAARTFGEFKRCLGEGKRRPIDSYATLNLAFVSEEECRAVDPTLASSVNVNTPDELAEWDRRLRGA